MTEKLQQYMDEAGVTSLADFSCYSRKSESDEEDEEAAGKEDDDVP